MSVKIKFDPLTNVEDLTFVLATRKGKRLGFVPAYNVVFKNCLNTYSEVSFRVSRYNNGIECPVWDKIKDFKTVWCKEWDLWFEITVEVDEKDDTIKNIIGRTLCEAELSQINLYGIEINTELDIAREDYTLPTVFYRADNDYKDSSLLDRLMGKAPHYTIVHVDDTLCDIQKTFEFDDVSLYDAFQTIAEEVGCLFVFNSGSDSNGIVKREISVYDLYSYCNDCGHRGDFTDVCPECESTDIIQGYGNDTGIFVSIENLAENITYSTDTDSVKNCFKLVAGDDLMNATIRNCNPNGTDYLWHISDSVKEDMSEALSDKIDDYDELYEYYQNEYSVSVSSSLRTPFNALLTTYEDYISGIDNMPATLVGFPVLMNAYYDTIDMRLFLQSELMPSPESGSAETDAEDEFRKLTHGNLSPVGVTVSLANLSETVASNAVLAYAKTLIHPNYKVSLNKTTVDGTSYPYLETSGSSKIWHGIFRVENKYDEDDYYTNTNSSWRISVNMTNDMNSYYSQKVSKMFSEKATNDIDIVDIFSNTLNDFKDILTHYCLDSLSAFYDACQSALDILIEQGASQKNSDPSSYYQTLYLPYYRKLKAIQDEISQREDEIYIVESLQNFIINKRNYIQDELNFEDFLGTTLWHEFCSYRRDNTYSNTNYISDGLDNAQLFKRAMEFIEAASLEIYKSAELQHSITGTLRNLLAMEEFQGLVNNFEVGNWLRISVDDSIYKLRLLNYEINYDNLENINVEFSDVMKVVGGLSDVKSVLDQAASMATSYDYVARQAQQGADGNRRLDNWVEKGLSLTNSFISSADNQEVMLDNHGLLMREYFPVTETYNDKQLKIINKGLYVTDDNWESSRAGIGNFIYYDPINKVNKEAYGVIADTLIGNLILGENVGIYTTQNDITLNKNGFIITNENNNFATNPVTITMNPNNSNGLLVIESKNNGNILKVDLAGKLTIGNNNNFVVNANGNINCQNLHLGASCSIDWNNVNDNGAYSLADSAYDLADDAFDNIVKLANGTYTGHTFIDGKQISSPTIRGGYIVGGKFFAVSNPEATISNGNISGVQRLVIDNNGIVSYNSSNSISGINISADTWGNVKFYTNSENRGAVGLNIDSSITDITLSAKYSLKLKANTAGNSGTFYGIKATNQNIDFSNSNIDFTSATITGLSITFG